MKILRKIIDCESLEIFHKKLNDGFSFSKVTSLQRTHYRFFLENVPKTSCLKIKKSLFFLRKKSMVDQGLNKIAAL